MAKEPKLYELGLLLKPSLSEGEAAAELGNVRSVIEKNGGMVESTTDSKLRALTYPIEKLTQAYFAALQFSVSPDSVSPIEKEAKTNEHVLRHLLLSWEREPARTVIRQSARPVASSEEPRPTSVDSPASGEEQKVDEQELEKKLGEILGQ